ncbi:MAG: hypothetical protein ACOY0T_11600 [Myxococcota bacterium]
MQRACFAALLVLACARPPSTRPLGGNEWLPPERTYDRKPRELADNGRPEPKSASAEAPADLGDMVVVVASPKPAASAVPLAAGEIEFKSQPLAKGDVVTLETRFKLEANFAQLSETASAEAHERIEVRVLDASADAVREVEVSYVSSEGTFRFAGNNEQKSNAGKRFRVRVDGAKPVVTRLSASKGTSDDDDDEKGVVFDLATVTGYLPLVRPHLPAKVAGGWKAELSKDQLASVFGKLESVQLERGWLNLRGLSQDSEPLAEFDCGMPIHLGRDGFSFRVDLKGRCSVRPQDTRPIDISLSGALELEASGVPGAKMSGRLEASVKHTYSR